MMYRNTPKAQQQINRLVEYMIDKGETLQSTLSIVFDVIDPSDPATLRRRVIEAYCANGNPKKATRVNDPSQCKMVQRHDYTLVVGGGE